MLHQINAILIAPNFVSYCGVRDDVGQQGENAFYIDTFIKITGKREMRRPLLSRTINLLYRICFKTSFHCTFN